jgi:NAD dependent epimerase/dehydratase family enzyme
MARATILSGQRVRPAALSAAGFEFRFPTLEQALRHELAD